MGVGFGLVIALPAQSGTSTIPSPTGPVSYVNLTVNVNATNGWPQYSPANFTTSTGRTVFTIVDNDSPMSWSGCPCSVGGTVDGLELINGTPVGIVPPDNVAHSFNVPELGIQIMSPGQSVVQFTVDIERTGQFIWFCIVPCGTGADPYNTPPMGVPGWIDRHDDGHLGRPDPVGPRGDTGYLVSPGVRILDEDAGITQECSSHSFERPREVLREPPPSNKVAAGWEASITQGAP